jgi:hypothetical protein
MHQVILSALVAGILTMFAPGRSIVVGADQPSQTPNATVFLHTDRQEYSLGEKIVIDVGVRNDGREPLYVYNRMAWGMGGGGLVLWLRDKEGKIIDPVFRDDAMLEPPPEDDPSIFARLRQGMFIGTRRRMEVKFLVRRAGRYTIQVEYRAMVSQKTVSARLQALPALWMESPSLFSEQVTLDIRQ